MRFLYFFLLPQFCFAQWLPVNSALPLSSLSIKDTIEVTCLAASPSQVYAGTTASIFAFDEKKNQWKSDSGSYKEGGFNELLFDDNELFACNEDGIYRKDKLGNWSTITYDNHGLTNMRTNVLVKDGSDLYAGGYDGVFLSSANGVSGSWKWIFRDSVNGFVKSLMVMENIIYAGTFNEIYISSDKGKTWKLSKNGLINEKQKFSNVNQLSYFGEMLLAGTNNGLFTSADKGNTWTLVKGLPDKFDVKIIQLYVNTIFASDDHEIYQSDDKGKTWVKKSEGLPIGLYLYSSVVMGNFVYLGTSSGVWRRAVYELIRE